MEDREFNDLKSKVDKLEYVEIKGIKEDISNMKLELNTNNILTNQSIEANKKLTDTMDALKNTMVELAQNVKEGNHTTTLLADKVEILSNKVSDVEDKVETRLHGVDDEINKINDKSKIDWQTFVKDNWFSISVLALGCAYMIFKAFGISLF